MSIQELYVNSYIHGDGLAKKEALFVPKSFNAAGREQIRRLIRNYRNAKTPDSVNIHDIIKYALENYSPDFKQGVFKGLRIGKTGAWEKIGRNRQLGSSNDIPNLQDSPLGRRLIKTGYLQKTAINKQPNSSDVHVKIKDILKMLDKDKPKGSSDVFKDVYRLDLDTRRKINQYMSSPYYSIDNYFTALRRKLSAEKLLQEAKAENYLNLSKVIKNKNKDKWVYRALQGDFNSEGSRTLFDQWKAPFDYVKRKAVFVSQHPEVAAQYLRYSDNNRHRSLAIIKDPVVRKFVEKTSTPDIGTSIPLSDRLLGRAHLDPSLRHSFRAGYDYNIPQNEYEAVLPYSLYKKFPIEIYDAIDNRPYYKRGYSGIFNIKTPTGDFVPRFWKKRVE